MIFIAIVYQGQLANQHLTIFSITAGKLIKASNRRNLKIQPFPLVWLGKDFMIIWMTPLLGVALIFLNQCPHLFSVVIP